MKQINCKEQCMKHMSKDFWERMPVEVVMILMYMYILELEPIFVEKNQL